MNMTNFQKNQQGAALVVGLVLLVVITVLAISGMNTATTELAMARNDQKKNGRWYNWKQLPRPLYLKETWKLSLPKRPIKP